MEVYLNWQITNRWSYPLLGNTHVSWPSGAERAVLACPRIVRAIWWNTVMYRRHRWNWDCTATSTVNWGGRRTRCTCTVTKRDMVIKWSLRSIIWKDLDMFCSASLRLPVIRWPKISQICTGTPNCSSPQRNMCWATLIWNRQTQFYRYSSEREEGMLSQSDPR